MIKRQLTRNHQDRAENVTRFFFTLSLGVVSVSRVYREDCSIPNKLVEDAKTGSWYPSKWIRHISNSAGMFLRAGCCLISPAEKDPPIRNLQRCTAPQKMLENGCTAQLQLFSSVLKANSSFHQVAAIEALGCCFPVQLQASKCLPSSYWQVTLM